MIFCLLAIYLVNLDKEIFFSSFLSQDAVFHFTQKTKPPTLSKVGEQMNSR